MTTTTSHPPCPPPGGGAQWTAEAAAAWYAQQAWLVGANFLPSTSINQLEMWQADTFDPETIDRELGWAAEAGFNCMRVFLHDLLWTEDPGAFCERIDHYLSIAAQHGIKTMLVLFDSVWNPHPALGEQEEPVPGVHNPGWVQGPHIEVLKAVDRHEELKPYVVGILERFGQDPRVLMWDLYNEPGNSNWVSHKALEPENKAELCRCLVEKLYGWARRVAPMQPLTTGAWQEIGCREGALDTLDQYMLDNSDIVSFHSYDPLEKGARRAVERVKKTGRPMICTEYMARTVGSTFQEVLPFFQEENVGAINWGLVTGKSQTIYHSETWLKPCEQEPSLWFHDVFRADGTPFAQEEVDLIRRLTGSAGGNL